MALLIISGALALLVGILFIAAPQSLEKMSEWANTHLFSADQISRQRERLIGVLLLIAAAYIFYTVLRLI